MPLPPNSTRLNAAAAAVAATLALLAGACSAPHHDTADTTATPDTTATAAPARPEIPANAVFAFTWFDKDQGASVSSQWAKARDAMAALGGQRFSSVYTTMDWERSTNVMAVSVWDDEESAIRGLRVSEAQVPARGWAKSSLYRRIATDGNMSDSLLRSIVMVLPVATAMDRAHAAADFDTINTFMKTQTGYIASLLFERISGDSTYQHLIAARWATREDLRRVGGVPAFRELRKRVKIAGVPTTYLQLPI